ncbi:DUF975 family protein [Companilactobacillus jidongensis]|uniref:DUF975 family protein n=1 Tax=Companilactobacillus jidongensis TaxID=2486006 RepID=UPI000F7925FE|nr:DUF975 family protein [Companilactobacillus jidongensis]
MKNYQSRYELKRAVKDLLHRDRKKASLLFMLPMFVIIFTQFTGDYTSRLISTSIMDQFYLLKNLSMTLLTSLIIGVVFLLIIQSANFKGLDWLRDPEEDFEPLPSNFTYFRNPDWWRLILTYLLMNIFTFLWSLLLVIPGIIKTFSYSQTYFVYKDLNDKGLGENRSLTDYITISRKLMDGNKWRFFVLQLSFIGWWLLAGIVAAIGAPFGAISSLISTLLLALYMLWFYPYYTMTLANFYNDLADKNPELLK